MTASAARSVASLAPLAILAMPGMRLRVAQEVAGHGPRVRGAVLVAQLEHLVVDAAVGGPIADGPVHRPRDAPALAALGDGGGLHVERDHALGPEGRELARPG